MVTPMSQPQSNDIVELALVARKQEAGTAELMQGVLLKAGCAATEISERILDGKAAVCVYLDRKHAAVLQTRLEGWPLKNLVLKTRVLASRDWRDKWKTHFRPLMLTSDIKVFPAWWEGKVRVKKGQRPIWISTDLAFGTGLHETTRMTAQLLERCQGRFKTFLDIGTGSGILTVVAGLYGAEQLDAIDCDPQCVRTARDNLQRNGVTPVRVILSDAAGFSPSCRYDLVAANLITPDLIRLKRTILKHVKKGGSLAISGISLENLRGLQEEFRRLPVRCVKILRGRKWAAVLYRRRLS